MMSKGWTETEMYLWVLRTFGIPSRITRDKNFRASYHAPFTRISPEKYAEFEKLAGKA